ncbi:hypothetical protein TNCV_1257641 [Trichonephila clavipes]|nr:hypothetical protein TNCV_1257641 [Trichonephila clavipes]
MFKVRLFASLLHISFLGFGWKRVAINSGPKNRKDLLKKRRRCQRRGPCTSQSPSDLIKKFEETGGIFDGRPLFTRKHANCKRYSPYVGYIENNGPKATALGTPHVSIPIPQRVQMLDTADNQQRIDMMAVTTGLFAYYGRRTRHISH